MTAGRLAVSCAIALGSLALAETATAHRGRGRGGDRDEFRTRGDIRRGDDSFRLRRNDDRGGVRPFHNDDLRRDGRNDCFDDRRKLRLGDRMRDLFDDRHFRFRNIGDR